MFLPATFSSTLIFTSRDNLYIQLSEDLRFCQSLIPLSMAKKQVRHSRPEILCDLKIYKIIMYGSSFFLLHYVSGYHP